MASENKQIVLLPYPQDIPLTGAWQQASTVVATIPRMLISYYDLRIAATMMGELQNAEAAFGVFDNAGNPIPMNDPIVNQPVPPRQFGIIASLGPTFTRYGSDLVDISPFFRNQQIVCLGVMARQTVAGGIARNLTVILYLGTVTIGRQAT